MFSPDSIDALAGDSARIRTLLTGIGEDAQRYLHAHERVTPRSQGVPVKSKP